MNNLDVAAEYSVRLVDEVLAGQALDEAFFLPSEIDRARIALLSIRSVDERFRSVLKVRSLRLSPWPWHDDQLTCSMYCQTGLDHLFNQLVRPRLRPLLADVYRDISYVLNEESYAEADYRDDVRKRFIMAWENLLSSKYRVCSSLALCMQTTFTSAYNLRVS